MNKKQGFFTEEDNFSDSPSRSGRLPERSRSQFISLGSYQISKEQPSEPMKMEELPNITNFLNPDDLSLLYSTQKDLNSETSDIISLFQNSDKCSKIIAESVDDFSNELSTHRNYLENVPEFNPNYLNIQELKARIKASNQFYSKISNEDIYSEIPKMFDF